MESMAPSLKAWHPLARRPAAFSSCCCLASCQCSLFFVNSSTHSAANYHTLCQIGMATTRPCRAVYIAAQLNLASLAARRRFVSLTRANNDIARLTLVDYMQRREAYVQAMQEILYLVHLPTHWCPHHAYHDARRTGSRRCEYSNASMVIFHTSFLFLA